MSESLSSDQFIYVPLSTHLARKMKITVNTVPFNDRLFATTGGATGNPIRAIEARTVRSLLCRPKRLMNGNAGFRHERPTSSQTSKEE
jgi:hypothetical protein